MNTFRFISRSALALTIFASMASSAFAGAPPASTDNLKSFGTNWSGLDKSKSGFGIDIDFGVDVTAKRVTWDDTGETASINAYADAGGRAKAQLFGKNLTLMDADAHVSAIDGATMSLKVAGITVINEDYGYEFETTLAEIPVAGVGGERSYSIAGINVSAESYAGGILALDLAGTADVADRGVSLSLIPSFTVGASVAASVSVLTFTAGVEGDITLASVAMPATASLRHVSNTKWTYGFDLDLDWEVLSGSLKVYAKEKATGAKTKKTLFSFDGYSDTIRLLTSSTNLYL